MQVLNTPKILPLYINISYEKPCGSRYVEMFLLLHLFNFQVHMKKWHQKGKISLNVAINFLKISNQKT